MFVHQGPADVGERFFARLWPDATAIADPERRLFDAFSLRRGSLGQVLGPRALASGLRAALRGNGLGKAVGDVWRMPGAFVLHGEAVLWSHPFGHIGELPDYRNMPGLMSALARRASKAAPTATPLS